MILPRTLRLLFVLGALLISVTSVLRAADAAPAPSVAKTAPGASPTPPPLDLDPKRIDEIAAMLPQAPKGVAPSFDDRRPWEKLAAADPAARDKIISKAVYMLTQPIPTYTVEEYEEAARTLAPGVSQRIDSRRNRLMYFMLAEGIENKGRFTPAILKEIDAICSEHTWVIAAHKRFTVSSDLGAAMTSWSLATSIGMLGNRMPPEQQKKVKDLIIARLITPYAEQIRNPALKQDWWRTNGNNWNAVVHAGIAGSALAVMDSPHDRGEIIAAVEKEIQYYLEGFSKDGYSQEGIGYWVYGFGHFILLAEAVNQATASHVDLLKSPIAARMARFPERVELAPGVYPAYADSALDQQIPGWISDVLNTRYGIGRSDRRSYYLDGTFCNMLYAWGVNLGFNATPAAAAKNSASKPLYTWFDQAQILVSHPAPGGPDLAVSIKGGNNGVAHSHDDLGQFIVTMSGKLMITDPGAPVYDALVFSSHRYDSQIINSYGHSVPVVNGKLQGTGPAFGAQVKETSFTEDAASITLNLRGGYDVFALNELTRKLMHDRKAGSVTVSDHMTADKPITFGTGLGTYAQAMEESPGVWTLAKDGQSVRVAIDANGAPFTVTKETLKYKSRIGDVTRLGINLNDPVAEATITVKVTPNNPAAHN